MLWSKFIQPYLLHYACSSKSIMIQRKKIVSQAEGIVLEIGFGSGLNLPFFNKKMSDMRELPTDSLVVDSTMAFNLNTIQ